MKKYVFISILIGLGVMFYYVSINSYKNGKLACESDYIKKERDNNKKIQELQSKNQELNKKLQESLKNEREFKEILNTIIPNDVARLLNNI